MKLKHRRKSKTVTLLHGDCLKLFKKIPDNSVDMVLTDPPYGITVCKWDTIIPLKPMWKHLKRVVKKESAIVMTAVQPFTTVLISSNMKMFKYCWVWEKSRSSGIFNAKHKPMKNHEDVVVFSFGNCANKTKNRMTYNPQGLMVANKILRGTHRNNRHGFERKSHKEFIFQKNTNYPTSLIKIKSEQKISHETQKPVALMEYLIKTYTNKNDVVLDFAMGSGTTGVAARRLDRTFIGMELRKDFFQIAEQRINDVEKRIAKIDSMFGNKNKCLSTRKMKLFEK